MASLLWLASWMGNLIAYFRTSVGGRSEMSYGHVSEGASGPPANCEGIGLHRGGIQAGHEKPIGGELHLREGHTNTTKGGLIRSVHVPSESSLEKRRTWGHSLDDGGQLLFKNLF